MEKEEVLKLVKEVSRELEAKQLLANGTINLLADSVGAFHMLIAVNDWALRNAPEVTSPNFAVYEKLGSACLELALLIEGIEEPKNETL